MRRASSRNAGRQVPDPRIAENTVFDAIEAVQKGRYHTAALRAPVQSGTCRERCRHFGRLFVAKVAFLLPGSVTLRLTRVQAERKAAFRVVFAQAAITVVVGAVAAIGWGTAAGKSALWGGGIGTAASALMAIAIFRYPEGAAAARIAWGFFLGQFLKVVLSIALLIVAFRARGTVAPALLAGYGATLAGYWMAPRMPLSRY
jgi:ATP synthase protein I